MSWATQLRVTVEVLYIVALEFTHICAVATSALGIDAVFRPMRELVGRILHLRTSYAVVLPQRPLPVERHFQEMSPQPLQPTFCPVPRPNFLLQIICEAKCNSRSPAEFFEDIALFLISPRFQWITFADPPVELKHTRVKVPRRESSAKERLPLDLNGRKIPQFFPSRFAAKLQNVFPDRSDSRRRYRPDNRKMSAFAADDSWD